MNKYSQTKQLGKSPVLNLWYLFLHIMTVNSLGFHRSDNDLSYRGNTSVKAQLKVLVKSLISFIHTTEEFQVTQFQFCSGVRLNHPLNNKQQLWRGS